MKTLTKTTLGLAAFLALIIGITHGEAVAEETESRLRVKEACFGSGIENRALLGVGEVFPEGSRVYFFTWILGGQAGDQVTHVWFHGEAEKFRIALTVGGPSWRTWSYKTMHPGSLGDWLVEVHDDSGQVAESMTFQCIPGSSE